MGCRPVSSWLITLCLKASPFNITIIQAYAPTTDYDDDDIEDFYDQLQEVIDQAPKKDILVAQGEWNAKTEEDASKNWKGTCGQYCNPQTNERGLRLLEFISYNNLTHKPSRHWTWHSSEGDYHNQIDCIMVTGQTTLPVKSHYKDQKLSRSQYWKWPWTCTDDLQATIGGKFAPLLAPENRDIKTDALINSFNTVLTETANKILGKTPTSKEVLGHK